MTIQLNTKRIDDNLREAQLKLNERIIKDSEPYVPVLQGNLRNAKLPDGPYGGCIEYDAPYAHYQYMGEIYGPNIPMKDAMGNVIGWWSPPDQEKKPTGRFISYHEPGTGSMWFEKAKTVHGKEWIDLVKRTAGKD